MKSYHPQHALVGSAINMSDPRRGAQRKRVVSVVFPPRQGALGLVMRMPQADPDSGSSDNTQINVPKAASLDNTRGWRKSCS